MFLFPWDFRQEYIEWVAISSSRNFLHPGIKPGSLASPALAVDSLPSDDIRLNHLLTVSLSEVTGTQRQLCVGLGAMTAHS